MTICGFCGGNLYLEPDDGALSGVPRGMTAEQARRLASLSQGCPPHRPLRQGPVSSNLCSGKLLQTAVCFSGPGSSGAGRRYFYGTIAIRTEVVP